MMKKRTKAILIGIVLLLLFTPIPEHCKDGGTSTYSALAYRIVDYRHNMFVYCPEEKRVFVQFFPMNFGPWPQVEMSP